MASFMARVAMSYPFAEKSIEQGGAPLYQLESELAKKCSGKLSCFRFIFGVYTLEAENSREAKKIILETWAQLFPEASGDISVLVAKNDGDDHATLMNSIYSYLYGVEAYQELTTELAEQIPVLRERGALGVLRMQNYLLAIDSGCGATTLISSFSDFLRRMNLFDDSDNRLYYTEYRASKTTEGGGKSPDDILSEIAIDDKEKESAVVAIDISCFLEGSDFANLRSFVQRLYPYQDKYVFVFRVPFLEKKALDAVVETLSDLTVLRVVQIPPYHDLVLMEFMWSHARKMGYTPDHSIMEDFFSRIRKEKKDGRFYGFKTAEKVINEIILRKASRVADADARSEETDRERIVSEDLSFIEGEKKKKTGYEELEEMIGMEEIEKRIREIVAQVKISTSDEKLDHPCIHMRFTGAPGTGKTTVARILGQILREEGVLRKGAFLEYSARSLVAEYVGQTAVKTAAICREAYGSVLFLDEAYSLYEEGIGSNDFGREALTTLVSEMENHRDDMLVIMAGYTDDMETLMQGNVGLRSRMPYAIHFPNYTREQLFEIYMLMVRKHFEYTEGLKAKASEYFNGLSDAFLAAKDFSNGRFVRNIYERTWSKAALRVSLAGLKKIELTAEDFVAASSEKEFTEGIKEKSRIGF